MQPYTLNDFLNFLAAGIENPRNFSVDPEGNENLANEIIRLPFPPFNELDDREKEDIYFGITFEQNAPLIEEAKRQIIL